MNILFAMIPAFLWGTTYATTQFTLPDWPPLLLGAIRALPAGLILFLLKPSFPKREDWKTLCVLGCINIAVFFTCIFIMALTLPSAISGVGMISIPAFAMLYHWMVSKQKPSLVQLVSGLLLILLAWILFNPGSITLSSFGLAAMLGAIVCIVIGSSMTKTLASKIHWWTVLTWQLIIGGGILSIMASLHASVDHQLYLDTLQNITLLNMTGVLWSIIFTTAIAYGLYVWLLQRMSVVDFTFGGIANPLAGILTGYILMNNQFSFQQYFLMGCMIATSLLPQLVAIIRKKYQLKGEDRG